MGKNSNIEWTDFTWNPWHGCKKVSDGCKNCYMFRDKKRYGQDPTQVVRASDKTFYAPLKLKEPQRVFTCSWSDFFIEEADEWRDEAFAIMALTPQHTYQLLTKRPERMLEYLTKTETRLMVAHWIRTLIVVANLKGEMLRRGEEVAAVLEEESGMPDDDLVLSNVWLGVSVEDQKTADERIPLLLETPAAVRFLSVEPMLGPVNIKKWLPTYAGKGSAFIDDFIRGERVRKWEGGYEIASFVPVDWVIVGGESGPNARPAHPEWIRPIRDQCVEAGVPFLFKQWGEWHPTPRTGAPTGLQLNLNGQSATAAELIADGRVFTSGWDRESGCRHMERVGKKKAGRLLDGRTWDEFPEVK